jgi:hypothetical protein
VGAAGQLNFTLEEFSVENLQIMLMGRAYRPPSASVSNQYIAVNRDGKWVLLDGTTDNTLPVPGEPMFLARGIVGGTPDVYSPIDTSTLVITDSAATPVTLELGTHYVLWNTAASGRIKITNVSGLTGPLKCSFDILAQSQVLPSPIGFGVEYPLIHPQVGAVVIKDSSATPKTVTAALYTVDTEFGLVRFTDKAGFVAGAYKQPLKASYSYTPITQVPLLNRGNVEHRLFLRGVNTVNDRNLIVDLYRVSIAPAGNIPFLDDTQTKVPLVGEVMMAAEMPEDSVLGRYGRIVHF